jgi:hypothetical protein
MVAHAFNHSNFRKWRQEGHELKTHLGKVTENYLRSKMKNKRAERCSSNDGILLLHVQGPGFKPYY